MSEDSSDIEVVLTKIKAKRQQVSDYLAKTQPRHSLLITFSIVAGALAAALTAGPGVGGAKFIDAARNVVSFGIPIWQFVCLAATVLSIAAVITNGMLKSYGLASKIANAQTCDAKLEGIETLLELRQINLKHATQLYTQYLTEIPHI